MEREHGSAEAVSPHWWGETRQYLSPPANCPSNKDAHRLRRRCKTAPTLPPRYLSHSGKKIKNSLRSFVVVSVCSKWIIHRLAQLFLLLLLRGGAEFQVDISQTSSFVKYGWIWNIIVSTHHGTLKRNYLTQSMLKGKVCMGLKCSQQLDDSWLDF